MRLIELFSVVPPLLAATLPGALTKGGFVTIVLIAALFGWGQVCLLLRPSSRRCAKGNLAGDADVGG